MASEKLGSACFQSAMVERGTPRNFAKHSSVSGEPSKPSFLTWSAYASRYLVLSWVSFIGPSLPSALGGVAFSRRAWRSREFEKAGLVAPGQGQIGVPDPKA